MVRIANKIRKVDNMIPILIQANAGLPFIKNDKTVFPETPEFTAKWVDSLINAGASIIGGCCGTTPEHIREIAGVVKKSKA